MRLPVTVVLLLTVTLLQAQEIELPAWMLEAVARDRSATADTASYAALHAGPSADSVVANRFIGTYKGGIRLIGKDQRVDFSGWADTTKGAMALTLSGQGKVTTITYLADLRANTAIMAASDSRGKAAHVIALDELTILNPLMRAPLEGKTTEHTRRTRQVMGITCAERYKLEGSDTLWAYASNIPHSPFVDGSNWMPMSGDSYFMAFGLLGSFGDPMPLLLSTEDLVIEITEVKQGRQPPPAFDLGSYPLVDERVQDWSQRINSIAPTLHDAMKPRSAPGGGGSAGDGTGSPGGGSSGSVGPVGGSANGGGKPLRETVLPPWIDVQSSPERRLLHIPAAPPIDAAKEEVLIMYTGNANGSIDLEGSEVLLPDGEGFKQPPYSPGELLALRMLGDFLFEPINGTSIGTIRFRFGAK
ncbi:MAG: hypothetical protein JNL05_01385 [Flavobacteriales bacterium]|nr:hypothetical protein [Flavobacteriales bacterium]